jgi:hypothetical protein
MVVPRATARRFNRKDLQMTDLERILAKTLMEVLIFADLSDDDDIDPDVATKLFEPVAAVLQNISAEDRRTVADPEPVKPDETSDYLRDFW